MIDLCNRHEDGPLFVSLLKNIINSDKFQARDLNESDMAKKFFVEIKKITQDQHIDEIEKILAIYADISLRSGRKQGHMKICRKI